MIKFLFIVFLLFTAYFFVACSNDIKQVAAIHQNRKAPSQIGDSITLLYTDSAMLKIVLKANRMLMFDRNVSEPHTVMPKGFFVTMFDQDEKISATLKGKFGVRFDNTKLMIARYKVEVVNVKGEKLETERLVWDENARRIYTDAFVKITTDKEVIMGKGLESNQDFSKYDIKEITGTIHIQNNETGLSK
ncbi:MAG: LPS export ABC transporter periplasmic protein LptC [Bacteroidetes bacterium]|nr:LPS export ABC transporter periplasmic protein LptC [Bacteroidota bacterium]